MNSRIRWKMTGNSPLLRSVRFGCAILMAFFPTGLVMADTPPFCALRFGFRFTQPDKWPEMREALSRNREAFDGVWFSTGVSFPKLTWHEEHARQCAIAAEDLRKMGIVPSIEIQTIIGHTDEILESGDCTGQDWGTLVSADARTDETTDFYADRLFPRLAAAHVFLKGYHDANRGTKPCGFSVAGDCPPRLVACRGVPIVGANGKSLGSLPSVASIKVRMAGSGEIAATSPLYWTRVMQLASTTGLTNFYAVCDRAADGRLPLVFESAVMSFVMPRVGEKGELMTVAIVNTSIDRQEPTFVRLRGVPLGVQSATWYQPEAHPIQIPLVRTGTEVRLLLPRIGAWECGYLSF